jgi:tRNA nucleotidyltransferase (CCA-adding enzyme)
MLLAFVKMKIGERVIIDIEKKYKKKNDVFLELNESKLHSPIILIDPTYKERNALASLSHETFAITQKAAREFLKRPSQRFFVKRDINLDKLKQEAKRKKAEFTHLSISTNKQPGDIAGTKLKKFTHLLTGEINRYFRIIKTDFEYDEKQSADVYFVLQSKKEIVRIGPPLFMKHHVAEFKREHMHTFQDKKHVHAVIKINFTAKAYLDVWIKSNSKTLEDMGIVGMKVLGD